jgi:16S rRNA (uracil1498-N3)-methyltransferase
MRNQGRYLLGPNLSPSTGDELELEGSEARHLLSARRARAGDHLELFDGRGRAWQAELLEGSGETARCRVLAEVQAAPAGGFRLTVASAVPRPKRMSFMVEKCAELGVDELIPVHWDRSPRSGSTSALERWRRLAEAAAKQSRRSILMSVAAPLSVKELLEQFAAFEKILLLAPQAERPLNAELKELPLGARVIALIGPEGGISDRDRELLRGAGNSISPVSLGEGVLRVETAAIAVAALVLSGGDRDAGSDD